MEEKDINGELRQLIALNFPAIVMLLTDGKESELETVCANESADDAEDSSDNELLVPGLQLQRIASAKKGQTHLSQLSLSSDSGDNNEPSNSKSTKDLHKNMAHKYKRQLSLQVKGAGGLMILE